MHNPNFLSSRMTLLGGYMPKRKVFVSYHHKKDQGFYNDFSNMFNDLYDVIHDNSLDRKIDSNGPEYVMRRIRENYLKGTSCTIVLCGAGTPNRKFVDWEIKATLDKKHALIGVMLPTARADYQNQAVIPYRLTTNYNNGYASWVSWENLFNTQFGLKHIVEDAVQHAQSNTRLIDNRQALMSENISSYDF